jgi:hypothetical protein
LEPLRFSGEIFREFDVCADGLIDEDLKDATSLADVPDKSQRAVAELSAQIIDNLASYRSRQCISPVDDWLAQRLAVQLPRARRPYVSKYERSRARSGRLERRVGPNRSRYDYGAESETSVFSFWSTSAMVVDGNAQMKLAFRTRQSRLLT